MTTSSTQATLDSSVFTDISSFVSNATKTDKHEYSIEIEVSPTINHNEDHTGVKVACTFLISIDQVKAVQAAMADNGPSVQPMVDALQYVKAIKNNCGFVPQFVRPIVKENEDLKAKIAQYEAVIEASRAILAGKSNDPNVKMLTGTLSGFVTVPLVAISH
jgi:hypothetical protein